MYFTPTDLIAIAPEIATMILALVLILIEVTITRKDQVLQTISIIGLLGVLAIAIIVDPPVAGAFNGMVASDLFTQYIKVLLAAITLFVVFMSGSYMKSLNIRSGEYYSLLMIATVGMMFLASAGNLLTLFLGIETMSITLYVLAGMLSERKQSNEAALKYFLLGAFSTGFLLFGIALTFGATGGKFNYVEIYEAIKAFNTSNPAPVHLYAGIGLIMIGLLFKVAAVPFHFWSPDVYQGSPTPVTAFMSAGPKAAALVAFIRLFGWGFIDMSAAWMPILWAVAAATMIVGNLSALAQTNIKRMLAYSSISHAGYLLLAVLAAGTHAVREDAAAGLMFYLVAYYLMNIGAFSVAIMVNRAVKNGEYAIDNFKGLASERPALALMMGLFMISLAGFPVTAGFMGKLYVFSAAVSAGLVTLVVIAVLASLISVFYYTRIIVFMFMKTNENSTLREFSHAPMLNFVVIICTLGILIFGVYPGPLMRSIDKGATAIFPALTTQPTASASLNESHLGAM